MAAMHYDFQIDCKFVRRIIPDSQILLIHYTILYVYKRVMQVNFSLGIDFSMLDKRLPSLNIRADIIIYSFPIYVIFLNYLYQFTSTNL